MSKEGLFKRPNEKIKNKSIENVYILNYLLNFVLKHFIY